MTFDIVPEKFFFEQITSYNGSRNVAVNLDLEKCPLGFNLSQSTGNCVCDPAYPWIEKVSCYIDKVEFLRPADSWLGFIDNSTDESGLLFHPHCPIGYCLSDAVRITANTSDSQCAPHRIGLLCGKCEEGYSLTLGDEKCEECSNFHLFLLLPFAVSGLLLVAVLFALNLTVTEGSINGLIF